MLHKVVLANNPILSWFLNRFENTFVKPVQIPPIKPNAPDVIDKGKNTIGLAEFAAAIVIKVVEILLEPIEI